MRTLPHAAPQIDKILLSSGKTAVGGKTFFWGGGATGDGRLIFTICTRCTVVLGPIWTNLVSNKNVIFFLEIVSNGQIRASRYKLWN